MAPEADLVSVRQEGQKVQSGFSGYRQVAQKAAERSRPQWGQKAPPFTSRPQPGQASAFPPRVAR